MFQESFGTALRTALVAFAACLGVASQILAQTFEVPPYESTHLKVTFDVPRLKGCAEATAAGRVSLYGERLQRCLKSLRALVAADQVDVFAGERFEVVVLGDGRDAREVARELCKLDLQARGVLALADGRAVLTASSKHRTDEYLWRASLHTLVQLAMHRAIPESAQNALGYGWLTTGLAHHCEATAGERVAGSSTAGSGIADSFVVHGVLQPPVHAWRGDWRAGAMALLEREQLPKLVDLLATESSDMDPAQHVLAMALVDWLAEASAPVTHGQGVATAPPIAALVAAARNGEAAAVALTRIRGRDLATIESQLHEFLRRRAGSTRNKKSKPVAYHRPHHHAAVFVYTRGPVRERHREIVQKALKQRHAAHTSGWQRVDGKPLLSIGPVNKAAGFWHGDALQKRIPRTWPMVAVLEYASAGAPTAYLDCFRRTTGRDGDKGWMLDPGVGFVPHHNAQLVTDHDKNLSYLAVPDTPTGSHVGGSEFVHRGRVTWKDGAVASVGMLTLLLAPKAKTVAAWHSQQTPLVDWFVSSSTKGAGIKQVRAVEDLQRELCYWGTSRVFRFPEIPDGLRAGRGR
tara:strand:- start:70896 stop:72626 length:1731 start_codon:yes stop_codon:yes gene_type:complete